MIASVYPKDKKQIQYKPKQTSKNLMHRYQMLEDIGKYLPVKMFGSTKTPPVQSLVFPYNGITWSNHPNRSDVSLSALTPNLAYNLSTLNKLRPLCWCFDREFYYGLGVFKNDVPQKVGGGKRKCQSTWKFSEEEREKRT